MHILTINKGLCHRKCLLPSLPPPQRAKGEGTEEGEFAKGGGTAGERWAGECTETGQAGRFVQILTSCRSRRGCEWPKSQVRNSTEKIRRGARKRLVYQVSHLDLLAQKSRSGSRVCDKRMHTTQLVQAPRAIEFTLARSSIPRPVQARRLHWLARPHSWQ